MPWEGVNPPQEPAGYDPDNKYKDPVVYLQHREAAVAEKFVKTAESKVRTRPDALRIFCALRPASSGMHRARSSCGISSSCATRSRASTG